VEARADVWLVTIADRADANRRLRMLLGERRGLDPGEVPILEDPGGKPHLDRAAVLGDLRFNLSHSGERALIAIAEGVEVGVDIERVTPKRSPEYLRDWTRREAYLKGTGAGLRGGPREIAFELAGAHLAVIDHGERAAGWRVIDLDAGPGYVAALAAASEVDVRLRLDPALAPGG
jgi:4'-phosphopantetheinyl transferase